ncbi:MAG: class I SAM-dependent methyltransferase [Patescibacteria group bacterium]|nr:class I SAM-dependent methyltransferase [Patescibacteria group bacterium]
MTTQSLFSHIRHTCDLTDVPAITDRTARYIQDIIKEKQPTVLLELGTALGYSTLNWAEMMHEEQVLLTIEYSDPSYHISQKHIELYQILREKETGSPGPQIIGTHGDIVEVYKKAIQGRKIDLLFIDAHKASYGIYLKLIKQYLAKDAIIIVDDVVKFIDRIPEDFWNWFEKTKRSYDIIHTDPDDGILISYHSQ